MVSQNQRTKAIEKRIAHGKEVDERRRERKKERAKARKKGRWHHLMNRIIKKLPFLIIFLFLSISIVTADISVTNDATWVKCTWDFPNATVYFNGALVNNSNLGYHIVTNINPNEEYRIDVLDIDNSSLYYEEGKTNHNEYYLITIILVSLILIILGGKFVLSPFLALLSGFYLLQLAIAEEQDGFFMLLAGFIMILGVGYPILLWKKK